MREPIGQGDDHGGVVRLGAAGREVAGPARRVDAEGLEEQVDAVLLEGGGRRMLPADRDVRAAPVGLVHGGERRRVRVDAEVAHVERAADVGVVEVGETAEDLHEPVHRDVAGARVEVLAHQCIERLEGRGVARRGRLNHGGISGAAGR